MTVSDLDPADGVGVRILDLDLKDACSKVRRAAASKATGAPAASRAKTGLAPNKRVAQYALLLPPPPRNAWHASQAGMSIGDVLVSVGGTIPTSHKHAIQVLLSPVPPPPFPTVALPF